MSAIRLSVLTIFSSALFACNRGNVNSKEEIPVQEKTSQDKVWMFDGWRVNPLLIHAFMPFPGERPAIVTIDLAYNGGNTFYIEDSIGPTTVGVNKKKDCFTYNYLGKTAGGLYVVETRESKGTDTLRAILCFSITSRQVVYEYDSSAHKDWMITLEKFDWLDNQKNMSAMLTGNQVTINVPGQAQKHIELPSDSTNPLQDNSYPPLSLDARLKADWAETDSLFYFHGKPLNPRLLDLINGGMSDGPVYPAIDIEQGNASRAFAVADTFSGTNYSTPDTILVGKETYITFSSFSYEYLGKTQNGVHVVRAWQSGGGSGVFCNVLFIRFRVRNNFDCNGVKKSQLLLCLEKYHVVGDRTAGKVTIKNNSVYLDVPVKSNAIDETGDSTHYLYEF